MPDDRTPQGSFDWKLTLLLMAIVSVCYVGYRLGHRGPRPQEVPCAPGQAGVTACNEGLAAAERDNAQAGRDREAEGMPAR